jgi:putative peptidoglycan lipid II flippase
MPGAPESPLTTNRKILRAAVVVGVFSFFALLGSVAKELVVAQYFGREDALDAFLIAYLLPSFLVNLVAGSLNAALIPTFVQVREREGKEAAQRLFSGVMVWSLGLLVGVSVLLGALAPYYLPLLGSGFSPAKLMLTRRLVYVLLPVIALSGLVVTWTAILNAGERFALPALLPILTPLSVVLFLWTTSRAWGIFALAWGTVIGVALQAVLLAWTLKAQGMRLRFRWYGFDSNLRQVARQYVPLLAGSLLMGSTELVDQSMAAMLQTGSVAALNYGKKVVSLVLGIGSTAMGTAALPYFSQMGARQDWAGCRHTLKTYSRLILLLTVPAALGLFVLSQPLVRILFQRGAFSARDTTVVSGVQAALSLQIPFYILGILGVRLISALKRNSLLAAIAGVNTVLNIILNLILMRFMGVAGIALSTSLVYLVSCVLIYGSIPIAMRRLAPRKSPNGSRSL